MSATVGNKKRTLLNFVSLSILQIGNYVLPMITLPIISRIIGPEKYGAINYAFAFVGYFIMLINAGFDLYGSRQIISYKGDKEKINELFSRITLSKVYICIASTLIFAWCLFSIHQLRSEKLIAIFTYLMCLGWIINPSWLYNGMQDSRRYAVFSFISKLLFSVAVVVMVKQRSDYIYHPLITSVAHILVSYISFAYALRKYNIKLKFISWRKIFGTINENKSLSVIWWITNQASSTGIVVAGFLLSASELGYYSAALRMIIIVQSIVSMPLNTVLFPYIGEAFTKSYQDGIERVHKTFPYLFVIAAAMGIGTFLISQPLILVFFGKEFSEAAFLLKISAFGLFFSTINNALGQQVMLNLRKDNIQIRFISSGFVLNVIVLILFINIYGTAGAALAWPVSEAIMFIAYMLWFRYNRVSVVKYAYYHPRVIIGNTLKMIKLDTFKSKGALR